MVYDRFFGSIKFVFSGLEEYKIRKSVGYVVKVVSGLIEGKWLERREKQKRE